ncbi:MAG: ABC transporter permease [Balneolales bacterium]|nr:ABC transporter permease [Balneolales bacterium]
MSVLSLIYEMIRNLNQQRLRTFLTIFGIMWGTATLILLLAFGMGFRDQTILNMRGMGDDIAIMFPGTTSKAYEGYTAGRRITLRESDVAIMRNQIPELKRVTPEFSRSMVASRGERRNNTSVGGVYPVYGDMRNIYEQEGGRWLNDLDLADRRRVVFLGNKLAERLFESADPVGETIMMNSIPFVVIGVMQDKIQNSSYSQRDMDRAFIPASTFRAITGTDALNNIIYTPIHPELADEVRQKVYDVLGRVHRFDPLDHDSIGIWDTNEFWKFIGVLFLGINGFLGIIGFFTLVVGGIGVANIMFVVVQERTREIGIRRSLGARRISIMSQFFLETFIITGMGAVLGYATGWLLVESLQNLPIREFVGAPYFSPEVGVVAFVVLSLVGFSAGLLPAWRASRLNIIDCLRS